MEHETALKWQWSQPYEWAVTRPESAQGAGDGRKITINRSTAVGDQLYNG